MWFSILNLSMTFRQTLEFFTNTWLTNISFNCSQDFSRVLLRIFLNILSLDLWYRKDKFLISNDEFSINYMYCSFLHLENGTIILIFSFFKYFQYMINKQALICIYPNYFNLILRVKWNIFYFIHWVVFLCKVTIKQNDIRSELFF
jgi:hypothetical protein